MYAGLLLTALGLAALTRSETRLALAALLWWILEQKVGRVLVGLPRVPRARCAQLGGEPGGGSWAPDAVPLSGRSRGGRRGGSGREGSRRAASRARRGNRRYRHVARERHRAVPSPLSPTHPPARPRPGLVPRVYRRWWPRRAPCRSATPSTPSTHAASASSSHGCIRAVGLGSWLAVGPWALRHPPARHLRHTQ